MSRIVRLIGSMCVAMLLAWSIGPRAATNTARADDCLAQPNSSAPPGSHWYYRIDRATQRKCWYLHALDQQAQQPAAQPTSPVTSSTPVPLEKPAIATSEATSISPIPVEKPKPATSRVRPTIPIPLEKPATVSTDAPMPVTPSTPEPPPPHIKMLRVISNGATDTLVQHNAKQQQNTPAMTAAPVPEQSPSPTSDQAHEPARAAIIWPDPSKSIVATTTEATTATSPEATTATAPEATTPDHGETPTAARTEDKLPDPRLAILIPDSEMAASAWAEKHGAPINHMLVIRTEFSRTRPDIVREVFRMFKESRDVAARDER